ncbi:MAG TPA: endonuclease [bacterium]|nr:endonuclease [bacterium]
MLYGKLKDHESGQRIATSLKRLRDALHAHFHEAEIEEDDPDHADHGGLGTHDVCRMATWNLREFAPYNKFGERLDDAYYFIAEILSHFDLVALQEVRGDMGAMRKLCKLLGPTWSHIATDVTEGSPGNGERIVFLFNRSKVWFRDIAGELTLPSGKKIQDPFGLRIQSEDRLTLQYVDPVDLLIPDNAGLKTKGGDQVLKSRTRIRLPKGGVLDLPDETDLVVPSGTKVEVLADGRRRIGRDRIFTVDGREALEFPTSVTGEGLLQFARTPYLASFQCGWLKMMLCSVHIYYGDEAEQSEGMERRTEEIRKLTESIAARAKKENDSDVDNFFFVLGDFNIVGKNHATMDALLSNDFVIPEGIQTIPAGTNVKRDRYYDQIAYWNGTSFRNRPGNVTSVEVRRAGIFDFFKHVYRMDDDDPGGADEAAYTPLMNAKLQEARDAGRSSAGSWRYSDWRTYQMSDHLPMWVELKVDYTDEFLDELTGE